MNFPVELFDEDDARSMVEEVLELFSDQPVVLTDELANSIYFNESAEKFFADRGEALVNRSIFSLLGFESFSGMPKSLTEAISGDGDAWRGFVSHPAQSDKICFTEASSIRIEKFNCGMIRFDETKIRVKAGKKPEA